MSIQEILDNDLKVAMKEHDTETLSLLRMLKSAIKNAEISNGEKLDEMDVIILLEKQAKQRRDAADQYDRGGRPELASKETAEAASIDKYLPAKLSEDELNSLVDSAIAETGASSMSDMGRVIKVVMSKAAGAADGKTVSDLVRKKLG